MLPTDLTQLCDFAHVLKVKKIESGEVDLWIKSLSQKHGDLSSVLSTRCRSLGLPVPDQPSLISKPQVHRETETTKWEAAEDDRGLPHT